LKSLFGYGIANLLVYARVLLASLGQAISSALSGAFMHDLPD
jgi:hypothetical protein